MMLIIIKMQTSFPHSTKYLETNTKIKILKLRQISHEAHIYTNVDSTIHHTALQDQAELFRLGLRKIVNDLEITVVFHLWSELAYCYSSLTTRTS